jgi:hypothetical protein
MQVPQEITKMVHKLGPIGLTQGIKDTLDAPYSRKVEIKSSNEKQQRVVDNGGKKQNIQVDYIIRASLTVEFVAVHCELILRSSGDSVPTW